MKIYDQTGYLILDVEVDDNSYRNRQIMADNNLTLYYSLAEHIELPVGSYCIFQGETYTLMRPEAFKMQHSRNFSYTVLFESAQAKAKIWKFRNTVPGDGRLKFPLTAKPKEHLQMFVDNMNRRDTGWSIGECIEDTEKLVSYDQDFCWDALTKMANEFNTEFEIVGKKVSLKKVEYNKANPLPLSYGRGNGFKPGVGRSNTSEQPPVEFLFVQGGTDNIDPSKYGNRSELHLPIGATIGFDGEHFSDEADYNAATGRTYMVDDMGYSIRCLDFPLATYAEDSLDRTEDYPKRIGIVSQVIVVDEGKNFYDIVDTNPVHDPCPDYQQCLIAGEQMTMTFQTGELAGRTFDVKYYHDPITDRYGRISPGRRFEIVPQEIDGVTMPGGDVFIPRPGDTYAVFNVMMPQEYIDKAEMDMLKAAVKYKFDNEEQKFSFTGELDGIWAKKDWVNIGGKLILGGFVLFSDNHFGQKPVRVRITGIKDYVNNPHSPKIELSNETKSASVGSTLKSLEATEVLIDDVRKQALSFTKRRFRDAKETIDMIEEALSDSFTERINPVAVETMSLLVGDERLQFQFYQNFDSTTPVEPSITWNRETRQLIAIAPFVRHMTLGIDSLKPSHAVEEYKCWMIGESFWTPTLTDGSQRYYLYIRAEMDYYGNYGEAKFSLETSPHDLEEGNFYWLLVGVLNSEYDGERSFATLYGFTEILPGRVTTDRIVSGDGQSYFDMANNAMKLHDTLDFNSHGDGQLRLKGTIVQSLSGDESPLGCFRGQYNNQYTYYNGDEVIYQPLAVVGLNQSTPAISTYRCITTEAGGIKGILPTISAHWQIVAQGSQGQRGLPGISPNTSFKSTAFLRSNPTPATPTGGSFANPVPDGWSDGVPEGEEKLWASTRIFSSDGKAPQQDAWTTPVQMTDTADFDVEFSSKANPDPPKGHPNKNTEWSDAADENTIWMATSRKSNGLWDDWQISRIKGEKGEDGSSIKIVGTAFGHCETIEEWNSVRITGRTYIIDSDLTDGEEATADTKYCIIKSWGSPKQGAVPGWITKYGNPGDAFIMENEDVDNGNLYVADAERWIDVGRIKGDNGSNGLNGKNAYMHIKYAKSLTLNDWTDNNGETPGPYIGIYADNNAADSMTWSMYAWHKWNGEDGLGYEYIYQRTADSQPPSTPTTSENRDGYIPTGWTDNPTGVSEDYPYEWMVYRQKAYGIWGMWKGSSAEDRDAALWAKFGKDGIDGIDGADGNWVDMRFQVNGRATGVTAPTGVNPAGWKTTVDPVNRGYYLWMTKALKNASNTQLLSAWSTPVRLTARDGVNGSSPAMVYRGVYDSSKTYYGNANRVDCVKQGSEYFIARTDAPNGTTGFQGYAPTSGTSNTHWNPFGANFESVATDLLLAENANIANLIFRNERLESETLGIDGLPNVLIDGRLGYVRINGGVVDPFKRLTKANLSQYLNIETDGSLKFATLDIEKTGMKIMLDFTEQELMDIIGEAFPMPLYLPHKLAYAGTELIVYNGSTSSHGFTGALLLDPWDEIKFPTSTLSCTVPTNGYLSLRCIPIRIGSHPVEDFQYCSKVADGNYYIFWMQTSRRTF